MKKDYDYYASRVRAFSNIGAEWSSYLSPPTEKQLRARFKKFLAAYRAYRKFCVEMDRRKL